MKSFSYYYDALGEYGEVEIVNPPLLVAKGLPNVRPKELVLFETGDKGWVVGMNATSVEIFLLTQSRIPVGTRIVRTNQTLGIAVGKHLLGHSVAPTGVGTDENEVGGQEFQIRPIDKAPKGIKYRTRINRPFKTGVTIVDMMVPIGYGQKELVIGDRKIGKTSFVLTTIKQQIKEGVVPIYALIGKKQSDIKAVEEVLESEGLRKDVVIVAASSIDSPSAIYLAPYTAMTIAEYFAENGQDVLVILDDLYAHARYYRELSLISNNFPGRDSYPGDIFYTHARLLERAGNFKHPIKGEVSITCLPVVETVAGDMTGYIQTNLMGITDGHILFDSEIFYNGIRPAVNIHLSVTRAGRQAQSKINRDINRELTSFLTLYENMLNLSHFGSELTESVVAILHKGDMLFAFFNQPEMSIFAEAVQIILFSLIWIGLIKEDKEIPQAREKLQINYQKIEIKNIFNDYLNASSFNELLQKVITKKDFILPLCQ